MVKREILTNSANTLIRQCREKTFTNGIRTNKTLPYVGMYARTRIVYLAKHVYYRAAVAAAAVKHNNGPFKMRHTQRMVVTNVLMSADTYHFSHNHKERRILCTR